MTNRDRRHWQAAITGTGSHWHSRHVLVRLGLRVGAASASAAASVVFRVTGIAAGFSLCPCSLALACQCVLFGHGFVQCVFKFNLNLKLLSDSESFGF